MAEGGGGDSSLPWHWYPETPGEEEIGRRTNDNNAAALAPSPSVTTFQLSDASILLIWRNFTKSNGFPPFYEQGNITAYENGSEHLENHTPAVAVNPLIAGGGEGSGSPRDGPYNGRNKWDCNSEGVTEESEEWNEEDEMREIELFLYSSSSEEGDDWEEGEEDEEMSTGHYSPRGVDGKQWETMDEMGSNGNSLW